jgi:uncharacterized SAM-binding protein YcdF (DUF218 family)
VRQPHWAFLSAFARWWVVDEPVVRAEAVVVLGGDTVNGERVRHAVELYRQGWAPRVVLSGAYLRSYLNEVELMEREALALGMPPSALLITRHNADSTVEEAFALRDFLVAHNLRRIIVSTSDYHTRRARSALRTVLNPVGIQARLSAARSGRFEVERWWRERVGLSTLVLEGMKRVNDWWELRRLRRRSWRQPKQAPVALLQHHHKS